MGELIAIIIAIVISILILDIPRLQPILVFIVSMAELQYGEKNGELKLDLAYKKFKQVFPVLGNIISRQLFEDLVDNCLQIMRKQIYNDKKLK